MDIFSKLSGLMKSSLDINLTIQRSINLYRNTKFYIHEKYINKFLRTAQKFNTLRDYHIHKSVAEVLSGFLKKRIHALKAISITKKQNRLTSQKYIGNTIKSSKTL